MDIKAIKRWNTLRELASNYEYGQFNLLEGNFHISYFESADKFILKNFFNGHYQSNKGTCRELVMKSFNDIKAMFPELYVTRTFGQDDKFFKGKEGHHWYNIITEYNPQQNQTANLEEIAKDLIKNDALVFDPCFRVVKKFKDTNYKIIELFDEKHQFDTIKDISLDKQEVVPLIYNHKKNLLTSLHNQPGYKSKLGIYFQNLCAQDGCDINSPALDSTGDENIKKFAEVFRSKLENLEIQCPRKTAESFQ